jgi:hypothetical protein
MFLYFFLIGVIAFALHWLLGIGWLAIWCIIAAYANNECAKDEAKKAKSNV